MFHISYLRSSVRGFEGFACFLSDSRLLGVGCRWLRILTILLRLLRCFSDGCPLNFSILVDKHKFRGVVAVIYSTATIDYDNTNIAGGDYSVCYN